MRIAVLVPVYNAGQYLKQCLDSVLTQTGVDLQVFCCDDGSQDDSLAILREYAERYRNVRFVSQANKGAAATRNRLLDELPKDVDAFAFMDADDYIKAGMYAKLAEAMERTGADIAECEWNGAETVLEDMTLFLLKQTAPGRWISIRNKLYRRPSVGAFRFRESLSYEEDFLFNFEVHQAVRRKVLVPGNFYFYRVNPDSLTHNLNYQRYFESAAERIRLSCSEYLAMGKIPASLEIRFRHELARDAFRMCLRKNLKNNSDKIHRHELFKLARGFLIDLKSDFDVGADGLGPVQRMVYCCCRSGWYRMARLLVHLV